MNEYVVCLDDRAVGKAKFVRQGMYTVISCFCKIPQNKSYDVFVKMADTTIPLGILVPVGDGMGTQKRVQSKKLSGNVICICISHRNKASGIPVEPSKPFPHISKIKKLKTEKIGNAEEIRLIIT